MKSNVLTKKLASARHAAQLGDFSQASRHYRCAVKLDRSNPAIFLEAGVNAAQVGDMPQARSYLLHAKKLAPRLADVHFNLGHVELNEKSFAAARKAFEKVLELDSKYPDTYYSLAEALYGLAEYHGALTHSRLAAVETPHDADVLMLKARCEQQLGMTEDAVGTLDILLSKDPEHLDARLLLAGIFAKRFLANRVAEQLSYVSAAPDLPLEVLLRVGDLYGVCGLSAQAREIAGRALSLAPESALAHAFYAAVQIDLGDFDLAETHFRAALKIDPDSTLSYQGLADVKRLTEDDRPDLERLHGRSTAGNQSRIHTGFALYSLNNKAGLYDEAFDALKTANRLLKEDDPADVQAAQDSMLNLRYILDQDFFIARDGQGFDGTGAVFIIGMPRSGTTLAEQILAGHPGVLAGGERTDVTELRQSIEGYPESLLQLDEPWSRNAGQTIHNAMFREADGHSHSTDKLPGNYAFAGLIKWVLPAAKFVYCRRQPEANALSLFEQHFNSLPFSRDLEDIATAYAMHLKIVAHWREQCGIEMFDLDYDALVTDPEPVARRLYDYLELDWHNKYLDVTRVARAINTASRWQVRQPINTNSVERWRHYQKHLQSFTDALARS